MENAFTLPIILYFIVLMAFVFRGENGKRQKMKKIKLKHEKMEQLKIALHNLFNE